jgi:hypothetical protein
MLPKKWKPTIIECECDIELWKTVKFTSYLDQFKLANIIRDHVYKHLLDQYMPISQRAIVGDYIGNIGINRKTSVSNVIELQYSITTFGSYDKYNSVLQDSYYCLVTTCCSASFLQRLCRKHYNRSREIFIMLYFFM